MQRWKKVVEYGFNGITRVQAIESAISDLQADADCCQVALTNITVTDKLGRIECQGSCSSMTDRS